MRALVLRRHGSRDDLDLVEDYPAPQAVDGHVVIRVRASSFNYHDVFTVKGMPGIKVAASRAGSRATGCWSIRSTRRKA
jgi:alcohol dehydrogenase